MSKQKGRAQERRVKQAEPDRFLIEPLERTASDEEYDSFDYEIPGVGDGNFIHVHLDVIKEGNVLVGFSVEHKTQHRGEWARVIRVDSAHEGPHVHRFTADGRESRNVLQVGEDMDEAWNMGYELVVDNINENLRRWRSGEI